MIKMVVSDMDGTLLNSEHEISEENIKAIKKLREQGIRFCIATGRSQELVKEYVDVLEMNDPFILCNGGVISHPNHKEKLLDIVFDPKDVKEITEYCLKNDVNCMLYTSDTIFYTKKDNDRVEYFRNRNKKLNPSEQSNFVFNDNINELVLFDINKILMVQRDPIEFQKLETEISKYEHLTVMSSQVGFLDINPYPASKGYAVSVLAQHFGYSMNEVACIGDQFNDISMIEDSKIGVAMGNAVDSVKSVSQFVTLPNEENGVAYFIEYLLNGLYETVE